nr:phosphatidylglycerophosphatase A [Candidatus Schneideria nysicola]
MISFFLFRLLDICKPWPICCCDKIRGGVGIILDDIVSGMITATILLTNILIQ